MTSTAPPVWFAAPRRRRRDHGTASGPGCHHTVAPSRRAGGCPWARDMCWTGEAARSTYPALGQRFVDILQSMYVRASPLRTVMHSFASASRCEALSLYASLGALIDATDFHANSRGCRKSRGVVIARLIPSTRA
jgi:hypothetical protein